jgi:sugar/nucleoside kinase (ribokinase family)
MNERNPDNNLLIVGSVAFDSVETPAGKTEMALGGSASFASIAASYWCAPLAVGVVGEDFGDDLFERIRAHGVDTRGIERVAGKTFHWHGRYHDDLKGRDTLETALNVFEDFNPAIPEEYKSARYVFLGNIDPKLQARVLDQTGRVELVAMDTMNFWIETARESLEKVLERVDLLFINDEEALQLSGERSVLSAARRLGAMGPRYLVVKRGEFGALLFGDDRVISVPAVLLEDCVDPTGAGDAFAGGFMGYLAGTGATDFSAFAAALLRGTVIASFAVEAFSVDGMYDLPDEVLEKRTRQLEEMIRF